MYTHRARPPASTHTTVLSVPSGLSVESMTVGKQVAPCVAENMAIRCCLFSVLILLGLFQTKAFSKSCVSSRRSFAAPIQTGSNGPLKQSTDLSALLDPSIILSADILSEENIHAAFSVATFSPQPFWVLLTLLPNSGVTKKIMGGMGRCLLIEHVLLFSLSHSLRLILFFRDCHLVRLGSFLYRCRLHCPTGRERSVGTV